MNLNLQIISTELLATYKSAFDSAIAQHFNTLQDSELSAGNFSFYVSVSAVFSSKIEGEQIELDSFIKHKRFGTSHLPDYIKKVDDLYDAYLFAQSNTTNR